MIHPSSPTSAPPLRRRLRLSRDDGVQTCEPEPGTLVTYDRMGTLAIERREGDVVQRFRPVEVE